MVTVERVEALLKARHAHDEPAFDEGLALLARVRAGAGDAELRRRAVEHLAKNAEDAEALLVLDSIEKDVDKPVRRFAVLPGMIALAAGVLAALVLLPRPEHTLLPKGTGRFSIELA